MTPAAAGALLHRTQLAGHYTMAHVLLPMEQRAPPAPRSSGSAPGRWRRVDVAEAWRTKDTPGLECRQPTEGRGLRCAYCLRFAAPRNLCADRFTVGRLPAAQRARPGGGSNRLALLGPAAGRDHGPVVLRYWAAAEAGAGSGAVAGAGAGAGTASGCERPHGLLPRLPGAPPMLLRCWGTRESVATIVCCHLPH